MENLDCLLGTFFLLSAEFKCQHEAEFPSTTVQPCFCICHWLQKVYSSTIFNCMCLLEFLKFIYSYLMLQNNTRCFKPSPLANFSLICLFIYIPRTLCVLFVLRDRVLKSKSRSWMFPAVRAVRLHSSVAGIASGFVYLLISFPCFHHWMTIRHKGKSQGEAAQEGTVVTQYMRTSSESSDEKWNSIPLHH